MMFRLLLVVVPAWSCLVSASHVKNNVDGSLELLVRADLHGCMCA